MIAPNKWGVAAPKFGCSRTWRGPKRGGYAAGSATNCQLGQMKIQGRTLEEASNSRVLLDDLITKIIITISRPSPVQRGLPWYLKWILALPPYLSYVHTYVTIYSLHNLCRSLKNIFVCVITWNGIPVRYRGDRGCGGLFQSQLIYFGHWLLLDGTLNTQAV